jgi:hypothetical protein
MTALLRYGSVLCLALAAAAAQAHHGISNWDLNKDLSLSGTLTRIELINPHAWLHLQVTDATGRAQPWKCEMRSAHVLRRSGWTVDMFKTGSRITVTGSGNLFPSGFTGGGSALSGAGVGLGLNLGARGNAQLAFPNNIVTDAFVSLIRADGSGQQFALSQAFFPNSATNQPWNGSVGVSIAGIAVAANNANPFVAVQWDIRTIPTPGAVAVLGMGVLVGTRRRRA